jgi:hypothetical protein
MIGRGHCFYSTLDKRQAAVILTWINPRLKSEMWAVRKQLSLLCTCQSSRPSVGVLEYTDQPWRHRTFLGVRGVRFAAHSSARMGRHASPDI